MTNGIAFLAAAVAGIAFHGVDISVLYPFHDTNMVGTSILSVRVRVVPIKEDDVAGARLIAAVPAPPRGQHRNTMWCRFPQKPTDTLAGWISSVADGAVPGAVVCSHSRSELPVC